MGSSKIKSFDFGDMISWLYDDFINNGYSVSFTLEEDPYLPIDLVCTKGEGKAQEWCFVLVSSVDKILEDFQKKLFLYQYYLSYHYRPWQYKIILAVPYSASIDTTPFYSEKKDEKQLNFYKENGFGLWRISGAYDIEKDSYKANTLADTIEQK